MRAGSLRHRITIQQATSTPDAAGQPIPTWATWLANEPAEVLQTDGAEAIRKLQVVAGATHAVRIRYRTGVLTTLRIIWEGRTLGIVGARDIDGRRRELWISCKESV